MMVPGSNLLNMALGVIQPTLNVTYQEYQGKVTNEFGTNVVQYGPEVPLTGVSVQPMTKAQVKQTGLELNRSYVQIWTTTNVQGGYRGRENDLINWAGHKWQVMPDSDWLIQDGWTRIIAVKL